MQWGKANQTIRVIAMLSRKQMRRLIKSVYGANNKYSKELMRLYKRASRQIQGEISTFLSSKASWSGKPSKDDLDDTRRELERISNEDVSSLVNGAIAMITVGHPKNSDLVTARISVPMINVAKQQHTQLRQMAGQIPQKVQKISHVQQSVTPQYHQLPPNYDLMLQRSASKAVDGYSSSQNNINSNIQSVITRIKEVAQQASQSSDSSINWPKRLEKILTGNNVSNGASGTAQRIIRTEACHDLNNSTIDDYQARGVSQYRFMSLEAENSCSECTDIDGNTYDVDDAEEGVNLPPMHPNCQCWIVEVHDSDADDLPSVDDMMDDDDFE